MIRAGAVSAVVLVGLHTMLRPFRSGLAGTFVPGFIAVFACALSLDGLAQPGSALPRPGDTRPELPRFEPDIPAPSGILPRLQIPSTEALERSRSGIPLFVEGYRISGNTVISDEELAELTAPLSRREIYFSDLEALRDRITFEYIKRGYVTSGALIPDQEVSDGFVEIVVVEGELASILVESDGRLRADYVSARVERGVGDPVDVEALEEQLQIVQQDERISSIQARLVPGTVRGESVLRLKVIEERPYDFNYEVGNLEPPSVGSWRHKFTFIHRNLTGVGDGIVLSQRISRGLKVLEGTYSVPLNSYDTRLEIYGERGQSEVVEEPLNVLDIESDFQTMAFTLAQPVYRTRHSRLELSLTAENRRSESQLLGIPFSFSPGQQRGLAKVFVLRFAQDWTHRTRQQALAFRSTFNIGLHAFGSTENPGDIPDSKYLGWLGQLQLARRLPVLDSTLVVRGDVQLSDSALLSLERFTIGGHQTVRGYRENTLVTDNGVIGSVEWRVPVLQEHLGSARLQLAPFFDVGRGWNENNTLFDRTLMGIGLGARLSFGRGSVLEGYWAHDLKDAPIDSSDDLQDSGIHLRLSVWL